MDKPREFEIYNDGAGRLLVDSTVGTTEDKETILAIEKSAHDALKAEVEVLKAHLDEAYDDGVSRANRISALQDEIERLKVELKQSENFAGIQERMADAALEKLEQANGVIERLEAELEIAKGQLNAAEIEIGNLTPYDPEGRLANLEAELAEAKYDLTCYRLDGPAHTLSDQLKEMKAELELVKSLAPRLLSVPTVSGQARVVDAYALEKECFDLKIELDRSEKRRVSELADHVAIEKTIERDLQATILKLTIALSEIRNKTIMWPKDIEFMSAKLKNIGSLASTALGEEAS